MSFMIYQGFKVVFATLYPAYSSYKAVKTKNVKEYVKWMMYWIVYAFFISAETVADIFVSWIPFYCEVKILFLLWMLSPTTKGASIVYRKLLHPQLSKRENEIDSCIDKASDQGYSSLIAVGSRALTLATNVVVASALKGQTTLTDHITRSLSVAEARAISADDDVNGSASASTDVMAGVKRSDSVSSSTNDDLANKILNESYRQEMKEKKGIKTT